MNQKNVFFVMGVSGSGKTTIGELLAKKLDIPFYDGDSYHPPSNVKKMAEGQPLNDQDREGWLERLNQLAKDKRKQGAIIACSALKKKYRAILRQDVEDAVEFIYLEGSYYLISKRLHARKGHFMPPELLRSQFQALEIPADAISISIEPSPEQIVGAILDKIV